MKKMPLHKVGLIALTALIAACSNPMVEQSLDQNSTGRGLAASTYATMNLRGTFNNWAAQPMTLVADYTWEAVATFAAGGAFKFDAFGNWGTNFGDNNNDGVAEASGSNISVPVAGTYTLRFNDQTKVYTLESKLGKVGLYYSVTNPRYPYTYSPLVGLDVKLYKGSELLSTTKISTAEHSTPYSSFENLAAGTYKAVVDALYYSYGTTTTRLHYVGERTFEINGSNLVLDPIWMNVTEMAAYEVIVYTTPYAGSYASPYLGLPVKIYKDGAFFKEVALVNGGKAVGYQPILLLNPLDVGSYSLVLDAVQSGTRYTAAASFTLVEKGPIYVNPSPILEITATQTAQKTVHYFNANFSQANIHYQTDSGIWTTTPGVAMTKEAGGWYTASFADEGNLTFVFNNGAGTWDSKGGANYSTAETEVWVKNGTVYTTKPTNTVTLKAFPTGVSEQYVVKVCGSTSPLSWTQGLEMTYNRNEKSFTATFEVEGNFEYKYVLADSNGIVKWESKAGNRAGSSGNTYTDSPSF